MLASATAGCTTSNVTLQEVATLGQAAARCQLMRIHTSGRIKISFSVKLTPVGYNNDYRR